VIQRLKVAAPKAERMGVILGIESYLMLLNISNYRAVGSKNVQCYYDFRNTADAGYDAIKDLNY
jgi:hypothetical protein